MDRVKGNLSAFLPHQLYLPFPHQENTFYFGYVKERASVPFFLGCWFYLVEGNHNLPLIGTHTFAPPSLAPSDRRRRNKGRGLWGSCFGFGSMWTASLEPSLTGQ